MASYWDFRHILDVNPEEDRSCVGTTKKTGERCTKPISVNDRSTAGRLLNQMDQTKDFCSSIQDLEQLAALMLCKEVHNSQKRHHLSQVDNVRAKWTARINQEYVIIKKNTEEAAMAKAKRELLRMRKSAAIAKSELEMDKGGKRERVCCPSQKYFLMLMLQQILVFKDNEKVPQHSIVTEVKIEDPFITKKATTSRANLFGPTVLGDRSTNYNMKKSTTPQYAPGPTHVSLFVNPSLDTSGSAKGEQFNLPSPAAAVPLSPTKYMRGIKTQKTTPTKASKTPSQQATRAPNSHSSTNTSSSASSALSECQSQGIFTFGSKAVSEPIQKHSLPKIQKSVLEQQNQTPISTANEAWNFPFPQSSTITIESLPLSSNVIGVKIFESNQEDKFSAFSFDFLPKTKVEAEAALTSTSQTSAFAFQFESKDSLPIAPRPDVARSPLQEKPIARLAIIDMESQDRSTDLDLVQKFESKENSISRRVTNEASLNSGKEVKSAAEFGGPSFGEIDLLDGSGFQDREDVTQAVEKTQIELAEPKTEAQQGTGAALIITTEVEDKENIPPIAPRIFKQEIATPLTPTRSSSLRKEKVDSAPISDTQRPVTQEKVENSGHGYGYAVITPPKRYSAYLPSVAKYGLYTPPATPETPEAGLNARYPPSQNSVLTRPRYSSPQAASEIALVQPRRAPSPAVSEVALVHPQETEPFPELSDGDEGPEVDKMCNCGRPMTRCVHVDVGVQTESAAGYDAYIEDTIQNFEDAGIEADTKKAGCFAGLRIGWLKEKIRERKGKKGEKGGKGREG